MSSAEGAPLLPSERDAPARRVVSSSTRWLLLGLGALFAVSACGAVAVVEYRNRFGISEDEIHARSSRLIAEHEQYCGTCALVIPSDTYDGKKLGSAIDSADCVVRFNAHGPFNCSDPGDGSAPKCPDVSDYGSKDDMRFINGNPEMMDKLETDPCVSSVGGQDPTCRRVIVTWLDGTAHALRFFGEHETAEVADGVTRLLGMGDLNEVIHDYAFKYSRPKPAYVSSAFIAMNVLKDPKMCGTLYAFGLETADGDAKADGGYADEANHKISPAHDYVLEHDYYKEAVRDSWPGWENVKVVKMEDPHGQGGDGLEYVR